MAFCCTLHFQPLVFNAVHHDTLLNVNSVTPKSGGDQYFDIHPGKTLPAGAMIEEEPTPPPLPTKSVLLHCVSLYVIPAKFCAKVYTFYWVGSYN